MREHLLTTRVRFGETDKMGVVYHPNYVIYFELGRTELMRAAGVSYADIERAGYVFAVTEVGVHYRAKAVYDQELTIRTRVAHLGPATIRFEYTISDGGRILADGHTELACLDARWKPARLPEIVHQLLG